jgi:prepilin-type N-terminal cleavage/methylation domain-containing protein
MTTNKGYTLIELVIVIVIFSVIGIITSQTIVATIRATNKSAAVSKVRQNVDYAVGAMERQLRGASSIVSTCNATPQSEITFVDQNSNQITFSCIGVNSNNQPASIASDSANLTSAAITLSACTFTCTPQTAGTPPTITINITANDLNGQNAPVTDTTQITLRSY